MGIKLTIKASSLKGIDMQTKSRKIMFGVLVVLSSFGLCGCGAANSTAKKAAKEYVEDKYGKEAKVITSSKNYKFTGQGGGLLPDGIASDESYNLTMEMGGNRFDVCLIGDGSDYIGYDNCEENLIKLDVIDDIESQLNISCEDIFLSYSELYGKYGTNMIHDSYSDLESIYESGKFAAIVATYDSIDSGKVEDYAAKYSVQDEKSILRIEIIQYKDAIPELSFSSFSEVNDPQYALDWYTISNGSVTHHD